MNKQDKLYEEYNNLKEKVQEDKSVNLLEDYKNKLIELDYAINTDYEEKLDNNFPMTTTLEKEEERLEKLINFIEENNKKQKELIKDYKDITGEVIELSYMKYTDNLKSYKERLSNVRKILSLIEELKENPTNNKTVKNKLLKKDYISLLYEFCLIDSLEVQEIDTEKIIKNNKYNEEITTFKEENTKEIEKENKEEIKNVLVEQEEKEEEEKILTTMPIVDKIGSVVPVNVFESLQKTKEELPDVVLPTNGLKDDENDIFVDTTDLFEEEKEEEEKK